MPFRYKFLVVLSIIMVSIAISLNPVNAAGGDKQEIPLPPNTEKAREEARRIAGSEFDFTYYASSQEPGQLKDFYRNNLTNSGWQEKTLLKDLEQIPGLQMEQGLTSALEQNLIFEKEGAMLIINFLPEGIIKDKNTRFTLAQGKIGPQPASSTETISPPELLAKPKKEVAPDYPGAALISLSEPDDALTATYFTQDDINAVAIFYKNKMPNYGWSLIEEKAPERLEMPAVSKEDIAKLCPSCAQKAPISAQGMESWMAQLSFVNSRQDTCNIVLSQVMVPVESADKMKTTTILVNYAEKKK